MHAGTQSATQSTPAAAFNAIQYVFICLPRSERRNNVSPIDVEPGSETQWIFWFLMGARLRANHENSQSRPN